MTEEKTTVIYYYEKQVFNYEDRQMGIKCQCKWNSVIGARNNQ